MITHDVILSRLAELRTTAEAATPGSWHVFADESVGDVLAPNHEVAVIDRRADGQHIATWSPAAALRWIGWAEQVAARHVSDGHERAPSCKGCGWDSLTEDWIESWPCPDLRGLAGALGLEETAPHQQHRAGASP